MSLEDTFWNPDDCFYNLIVFILIGDFSSFLHLEEVWPNQWGGEDTLSILRKGAIFFNQSNKGIGGGEGGSYLRQTERHHVYKQTGRNTNKQTVNHLFTW